MTDDVDRQPTKEERREANRAAWAARARVPLTPASEPCPDPLAPGAAEKLYGAAYARLWDILHDPNATNQDRIAAFNAARLAARVGQDPPPDDSGPLDFSCLIGGGKRPAPTSPPPKAEDDTAAT